MNKLAFALSLGLLTAASGGAQANLIVNGSFEDGNFSPIIASHFVNLTVGSTNLTGWQVSVGQINWHVAVPNNVGPAQQGTKMIDLIHNGGAGGTLVQTFATTPGTQYLLEFYLAGPETAFENPRTVRVSVGDVSNLDVQTNASPMNPTEWARKEVLFTAVGASTTLSFFDPPPTPGNVFWGAFIDSVSVVEWTGGGPGPGTDPVPAPSALLLLSAGLVGLGIWRRAA